ncbi:cell death regulator Aven [Maylandia zebra]|uniref:Apoptosis, caspase activation inhibitor n=1 Tax=Astatotilapia calliptera TaxID=8154 RepID=A0AAX7TYN2_ASTCA|nr:cell death regulator Aven [Maylandia zebra]XP_025999293.1 cell death regulator Aven [Astatotilapia calliptera]
MEGRVTRGSGRRGGRGGNDGNSFGGERRGRGGHHRGRGKREHHRGRGRGGGAHAAEFHQRDQDEGDSYQEDDDSTQVFSRRKLESNWDRYEESERPEPDDDTPTQRGTDFHVLLASAGDSFTHFRFAEEKEWEMDQLDISQMAGIVLDLPALTQILQEVPLHQKLDLEPELIQVSAPVELPSMTLAPKQEVPKMSKFTPPSTASKSLSISQKVPVDANPVGGSGSQLSSSAAATETLVDDADEELDNLLNLQKPVSGDVGNEPVSGAEMESAVKEKECEEVKDVTAKPIEEKMMEVMKDKDIAPPQSAPSKQEMTEEDLEDWLDSMIS